MAVLPIPLPQSTLKLHQKVSPAERHPGLQLDKFIAPPQRQEDQKEALGPVLDTAGDSTLLVELLERRTRWLHAQNAVYFACTTVGPLTLHLSRATALENAGICLHPLYGFVYLPGTGLKGMARAFAETVWFPAQPDAPYAWQQIEAVFGWCPESDRNKSWKPRSVKSPDAGSAAGQVVFHDAWPATWPKLELDILNNHHRDYYQGNGAPGDWESPSMVSFLAVAPDTEFRFALAKRTSSVSDGLLELAHQWLLAALIYEGAGAKTAAGYGCFKAVGVSVPKLESPSRVDYRATLELVTPAFLAGSKQEAADCDLRPATLRGLLRWWWRTMYAGHVDVRTLRSLEAAIWGDTKSGGAVRVTVERSSARNVEPFAYKREGTTGGGKLRLEPDEARLRRLGIVPSPRFTTQGLYYAGYGMDEISHGRRRSRQWIHPGAQWSVRLAARKTTFQLNGTGSQHALAPATVLDQAKAALWLLCRFGGLGSRCRKGFGSLKDLAAQDISSLDDVQRLANHLLRACGLTSPGDGRGRAQSPSLADHFELAEILLPWKNPYRALDEVAQAYEATALAPKQTGHGKHCRAKLGLGLPRQIHGPLNRPLPHQREHTPPEQLNVCGPDGKYIDRHASPLFVHFGVGEADRLVLRVTAFPSAILGGIATNRRFLEQFVEYFSEQLQERTKNAGREDAPRLPTPGSNSVRTSAQVTLPKPNQLVSAVLVEEKTQKGGWMARLAQGDPKAGPIQNPAAVPAEAASGHQVTLILQSITAAPDGSIRAIQFRWPTEADKARLEAKPSGPPRGPRRR